MGKSISEVNEIKRSLLKLIRDQDILEYADFMNLLLDGERSLEYDIASRDAYFFECYISSCRRKKAASVLHCS